MNPMRPLRTLNLRHLVTLCLLLPAALLATPGRADAAGAGSEAKSTAFHYSASWGMWTVRFDVAVTVGADGAIVTRVGHVRMSNPQAWAWVKIEATAHPPGGRTPPPRCVTIPVEVQFRGLSNHFKEDLETGKVTWGPPVPPEIRDQWHEKVPVCWPRPPAQYVVLPPQNFEQQQQAAADPDCDVGSRAAAGADGGTSASFIDFKKGHVLIRPKGCNQWVAAPKRVLLKAGDRIKTGADGRARIVLQGGAALIVLKPNSEITVRYDPELTPREPSFIELFKGVIFARARKAKNSLKVEVPNCIIGVRGTEFEASHVDGVSCVTALKHSVWFADRKKTRTVIVREGQRSCANEAGIPGDPQPVGGADTEGGPDPAGLDVSGTWASDFGTMTLEQDGRQVKGGYTHDKGRLEGVIDGSTFTGKWMEAPDYRPPKNAGDVQLVFSADGSSFTGHWRYGFGGASWDGDWTGRRQAGGSPIKGHVKVKRTPLS